MKLAHVSIRQHLLLTALVGIGVAVGIPFYKHYFPKQVSLPTPYFLFDEYPDDALKQIRLSIEDGTGAESPAVQEFAQMPTAEQIAGFKAKLVSKSVY